MNAFLTFLLVLAKTAHLYLYIKSQSFFYDIRKKSQKKQEALIDEIEKLRKIGDSDSSDRADILRKQLKAERDELEYISAFYNKVEKQCRHSDG